MYCCCPPAADAAASASAALLLLSLSLSSSLSISLSLALSLSAYSGAAYNISAALPPQIIENRVTTAPKKEIKKSNTATNYDTNNDSE
jgi:hypothetical protein